MTTGTIDLGPVVGPIGPAGPAGKDGITSFNGRVGAITTADSDTITAKMDENTLTLSTKVYPSNPNLLDNWYFIGGGSQQGGGQFPINQLGESEYTGQRYAIDRWAIRPNTKLTIENDGIVVSFPNSASGINQAIECPERLLGETVTISILVEENTISSDTYPRFGLHSAANVYGHSLGVVIVNIGKKVGLISNTAKIPETALDTHNYLNLGVFGNAEGNIKIRAVKLELGDQQTLAHQDADGNWVLNDPPPNYALELAKCQRYQMVLGGTDKNDCIGLAMGRDSTHITINAPLTCSMRARPTLTLDGTMGLRHGGSRITVSELGSYGTGVPQNNLQFEVLSENVNVGATYEAYFLATDGKLIIDANL